MMPFSPLRIWGTGILSWAILIGGIYCVWKWSEDHRPMQVQSPEIREDRQRQEASSDNDRVQTVIQYRGNNYWLLALGIGLLTLSGVGFLPVTLLLGQPGPSATDQHQPHHTRWIDRPDGSRLYIATYGRADGPTLLFTHGWSLDSTVWDLIRKKLAKQFRIVVWDLPGLGRSTQPANRDFRIEKMADDLAAVVEHLGPKPVILIGHSIGGMITQTYCRRYPQQLAPRIAGVVLLHTTYVNPLRTALFAPLWTVIEKPILVPLNYLTIWLAPLACLSNWQGYLNGSLQTMTRIASFSGRQSWSQLNYSAWLACKAWPAVVARGNLAMLAFDEESSLPEIQIPVLVISGKHDRMTKPIASERMEELLPHSVPASVASGHLGLWEQHEKVAELIGEFAERFLEEQQLAVKSKMNVGQ